MSIREELLAKVELGDEAYEKQFGHPYDQTTESRITLLAMISIAGSLEKLAGKGDEKKLTDDGAKFQVEQLGKYWCEECGRAMDSREPIWYLAKHREAQPIWADHSSEPVTMNDHHFKVEVCFTCYQKAIR